MLLSKYLTKNQITDLISRIAKRCDNSYNILSFAGFESPLGSQRWFIISAPSFQVRNFKIQITITIWHILSELNILLATLITIFPT